MLLTEFSALLSSDQTSNCPRLAHYNEPYILLFKSLWLNGTYFFEVKVARGWITFALAIVWLKGRVWLGQWLLLWWLVLGGGIFLVAFKQVNIGSVNIKHGI